MGLFSFPFLPTRIDFVPPCSLDSEITRSRDLILLFVLCNPGSLPQWPRWSSCLNLYKKQWSVQQWRHMHLIPGEVEARDHYELEASLLYTESSRPAK